MAAPAWRRLRLARLVRWHRSLVREHRCPAIMKGRGNGVSREPSTDRQLLLARREDEDAERPYTCAHCGAVITTRRDRVSRDGEHEHTFTNPAGLVFRIGCFRAASGCVPAGEDTAAYSWFPGFHWRYALCCGCASHLGWRYSRGSEEFYGLIVDQLIPPDE